jgi:hypothetical protein
LEIKSIVTSCIKVAIARSKSNHIRLAVIVAATSVNIVVVTKAESNLSINNYTIVNKGIKRTTTDSVYNKESDNALI